MLRKWISCYLSFPNKSHSIKLISVNTDEPVVWLIFVLSYIYSYERQTHVSLLINMGFTAVAIGSRVGHESSDITFRYAHMFPSEQKQMATMLNDAFVITDKEGDE